MGYEVYMTKAEYALQAKLFAEGGDLKITRVEVGSGVLPEGTDWRTLTELAESRAKATSTAPLRKDYTVSLEIEYRSDLDTGMEESFQINEFGLWATETEGQEALILYGDLSDCPDTAVPPKYGGCVRRYPVLLEMGPDADARLDYPAGAWVTHDELATTVATHNRDENAHPDLRGMCAGLNAQVTLLELMYTSEVSGTSFTLPSTLYVSDDGSVSSNTAPGVPSSITYPTSITGGSTWSQIYQGGARSTVNLVPLGSQRVMYRVKAYETEGLESEWKTSAQVIYLRTVRTSIQLKSFGLR